MVHFSKMRISGFKSFVDPINIDILPGLTGIVGPNGCGKSNLVEALRWVLGETSSQKMRGSGKMDDVIFKGAAGRPKRNFTDVSLQLQNPERDAPDPYSNFESIELKRRLDRGEGSSYSINGKNVRARDVTLFFNDMMISANSPALVSQGRVAAIINAKPHERRQMIEQATGIAGLHTRRFEAQSRLKATSANLERLCDIKHEYERQKSTLVEQAEQAQLYTALNKSIRELDQKLALIDIQNTEQDLKNLKSYIQELKSDHSDDQSRIIKLKTDINALDSHIEDLKSKSIKAQAIWQNQRITLTKIQQEESFAQSQLKVSEESLAQITQDLAGLGNMAKSDKAALEKIVQDISENIALLDAAKAKKSSFAETSDKLSTQLETAQNIFQRHETEKRTHENETLKKEADYKALGQQIESLQNTILLLSTDLETAQSEFDERQRKLDQLDHHKFENKITACDQNISKFEHDKEILENKIQVVQATEQEAKDALLVLETEYSLLNKQLENGPSEHSIQHKIKIKDGYERAVSRALGEAIEAADNAEGQHYWALFEQSNLSPEFPENIMPLTQYVQAPGPVLRALSLVGVIAPELGDQEVKNLKAGQSLVSQTGHLWRWDGYTILPEKKDNTAKFLEDKRRSEALAEKKQNYTKIIKSTSESLSLHHKNLADIKDNIAKNTELLKTYRKQSTDTQNSITQAKSAVERSRERVTQIEKNKAHSELSVIELNKKREQLKTSLNTRDKSTDDAELLKSRTELENAKEIFTRHKISEETLEQDIKKLEAQSQALADERISLSNRSNQFGSQHQTLLTRQNQMGEKVDALKLKLPELLLEKETLQDTMPKLEAEKESQDDSLRLLLSQRKDIGAELKMLETKNAVHQEKLRTLISKQEMDTENFEHKRHIFTETYGAINANLFHQDAQEDKAVLERRRDGCIRDREAMGPVNLRAALELETLTEKHATLETEIADLDGAIAELSKAIATLNEEAREKLTGALDTVNSYFSQFFERLFNGGRAEMILSGEDDDPLNAEIDIVAEPPGKKLQSLGLLSGGEQTMTAIALIFALFMAAPSPICVLDEIDAPLDDANVARLCLMLRELSDMVSTRFLVVTHHRMTMSCMDRLYGVTMVEKGVSKLVGVTMQRALDLGQLTEQSSENMAA